MHIRRFGCLLVLLAAGCSKSGAIPAVVPGEGSAPVEELVVKAEAPVTESPPIQPPEGSWPWWRGPAMDGKAMLDNGVVPPLMWSETENILWRTDVPGHGHASPVIWGDRVFLATADEEAQTQSLLAFDANSGQLLWNTVVHRGEFAPRHDTNSHASATPACDGQHVYGAFITPDALWVTAVDFQGNIVWQTKAGPFQSEHGYGSSPVLYKSLVIVAGDNSGPGYLTALDRATGKIVWRVGRTEHTSYSTPIITHLAGKDQLLLSGGYTTVGYDPLTGQTLWYCQGPTQVIANTMAFEGDLVYASGGYPDKEILCIRADGTGNVTDTHIVWRSKQSVTYVPSPVVYEGRLYVINDDGVATCFDAKTGKSLWKQRLGGNFSASPVMIGDCILASNEQGTTYVFKVTPKYELIATNKLGEGQFATPALAGGRIYIRTGKWLYCIGQKL